jgi:hypothetical protein
MCGTSISEPFVVLTHVSPDPPAGSNTWGGLGDGTTAHKNVPTIVSGNLQWTLISTAEYQTCGLTLDGTAYCWGKRALCRVSHKWLPAFRSSDACLSGSCCRMECQRPAGRWHQRRQKRAHRCEQRPAVGVAKRWGGKNLRLVFSLISSTSRAFFQAPLSIRPIHPCRCFSRDPPTIFLLTILPTKAAIFTAGSSDHIGDVSAPPHCNFGERETRKL